MRPTGRSQVEVGDSIRDDAFPTLAADAVLCAPPYGDRDWGHEELAYDSRWMFGLPPKVESELAWLQHCLAHLARRRSRGPAHAARLVPAAPRAGGSEPRCSVSGALRAVLALPAGIAQPLHIGLQLWLLERPHPQAALPATVLLVDPAAPAAR